MCSHVLQNCGEGADLLKFDEKVLELFSEAASFPRESGALCFSVLGRKFRHRRECNMERKLETCTVKSAWTSRQAPQRHPRTLQNGTFLFFLLAVTESLFQDRVTAPFPALADVALPEFLGGSVCLPMLAGRKRQFTAFYGFFHDIHHRKHRLSHLRKVIRVKGQFPLE